MFLFFLLLLFHFTNVIPSELQSEMVGIENHRLPQGSAAQCEEGKWAYVEQQDVLFPTKYGRDKFKSADKKRSMHDFLRHSCSVEILHFSCYYLEGLISKKNLPPGRSMNIEYTRWTSDDINCWNPYPADFIPILTNRKVLFIGDSMMSQIIETFICNLQSWMYMDVGPHYSAMFKEHRHKAAEYCPFDRAYRCHMFGVEARIPLYSSFLAYVLYNSFTPSRFFHHIFDQYELTSNDLVIINFGLHYNDQSLYKEDLKQFFTELFHYQQHVEQQDERDENNSTHKALPHILFLETSPQHFKTDNGYYHADIAKSMQTCGLNNSMQTLLAKRPQEFIARMRRDDWRNEELRMALDTYNERVVSLYTNTTTSANFYNMEKSRVGHQPNNRSNHTIPGYIPLIRIAQPLYSQFQAHVDGLSYLEFPDCTHWCVPNGIFHFIHRVVYHAWIDQLGLRKQYTRQISAPVLSFANETLVKGTKPAVFVVIDGKRYGFQNLDALLQRGYNLGKVHTIGDVVLESIPYAFELQEMQA